MLARIRHRRGFTLIELMTAVAIIAVLAALSVTAMSYGVGRARMNNAMFDVAAMISAGQLRAISSGVPNYVVIHQENNNGVLGRIRISLLERPAEAQPPILNWNGLDLTNGPEGALQFQRTQNGVFGLFPAPLRDQLVLGAGSGSDSGGISFVDLDASRIRRPLPAPFNTIPLSTPGFTPAEPNSPTPNLLGGCSFCVAGISRTYGIIRFNSDGTVEVVTGGPGSRAGGTIAFMANTSDEADFVPRLLTISSPAGAVRTF